MVTKDPLAVVISFHMVTRDLSLHGLATASGIPKSTLFRRQTTAPGNYTYSEIVRLARTFEVSPSQLLAEAERVATGGASKGAA